MLKFWFIHLLLQFQLVRHTGRLLRAIENQAYVIAAAQCERHNGKRSSYGDSIVLGPWGQIVGRLDRMEDAEKKGEKG